MLSQVKGRLGDVVGKIHDPLRAVHMQDQGIVLGPALCRKDLGHCLFIQSVGAQTVNRLRGDSHQAAVFDDFRGNFRGIGFICR